MDEVVDLPDGIDPNWGVKCDKDGNELENMSEKMLNRAKMNEQLAKAIEGKDSTKATQALARENAELKVAMQSMQEQISNLTNLVTQGAISPGENPDTPPAADEGEGAGKPELDDSVKSQIDETVKMLEDDNNDHWTARGEPKLDVIKDLTGLDLSRADVDSVNPRRRAAKK